MSTIHYAGQELPVQHFPVQPGESVLDCLLRNGVGISHSCKAGACQSCLVKASGPVPGVLQQNLETAQRGLKDTLRAQNYFLACSLQPDGDLTVSPAGAEQRIQARITGIDALNGSVLRVRLRTEAPFEYRAGQFVSLFREDGLARSYSLASLPGEDALEFHVRKIPGGAMSGWLYSQALYSQALYSQALHIESLDGAQSSVPVWIQGPSGNCFYVPGEPNEPLLLAGAGTGLAPLYGIARDALRQGHRGPIWLFHGALTPSGLYLTAELMELSRTFPNFHYVRSVLKDGGSTGVEVGELDRCILARFPSLFGWKGYVCGDPALVNLLRKKMFLAGMASKAIYADAFLPSAPASING
jgi:CDP-4-dehydro-6-deoxyglucose reductase